MKKLFFCLLVVPFVVCAILRFCDGWRYEWGCRRHLANAAEASTIELATREMATAITYVEENELVHGNTSLFTRRPENDVAVWYLKIKVIYDKLVAYPRLMPAFQEDTALMHVRGGLLNEAGTVSAPRRLSGHPYNGWYLLAFLVSGAMGSGGLLLLLKERRGGLQAKNAVAIIAVFGLIGGWLIQL